MLVCNFNKVWILSVHNYLANLTLVVAAILFEMVSSCVEASFLNKQNIFQGPATLILLAVAL